MGEQKDIEVSTAILKSKAKVCDELLDERYIFSFIMELSNVEIGSIIRTHKETRVIKGLQVPLAEINHYNKVVRQKGLALDIPKYHVTYLVCPEQQRRALSPN